MKLKQYSKYKDSGVQWIGEIPEDWENYKLKHIVSQFISGGTPSSDNENFWATDEEKGIHWVAIRDMSNKEYVKETSKQITIKGLADKNLKILKKGTLLYSIFASLGKVSILDIDATTNQAILGLIPSKKINNKLLKYYLISLENTIISLSNANTQNNLNLFIVKNINIALSQNLEEQTQITTFLDKKTQNIDQTIEKNNKLIELLKEKRIALINHIVTKGLDENAKMKDSGIDWIGEIPEGWEVKKLKLIADVKVSNVDKKSKVEELEIKLCNYTDVYYNEYITSKIDFMKRTCSFEQRNKFMLDKGDVMITKDSETADDIAVPAVSKEKFSDVVCGYHLSFIRPKQEIFGNFLFRLFQSKLINSHFEIWALGVTRFGVSTYPIKNSLMILPPKQTQLKIIEYLDTQTQNIDQTISKIQEKIILMQEYKKSLIHHVVTGKVDVRGIKN